MHVSREPALLKRPQAQLCTTCHAAQYGEQASQTYHAGIEGLGCTVCHNPHFADNPRLLKPEDERRRLLTRARRPAAAPLGEEEVP